MKKIDLFKEHRDEYSLERDPHLVRIGAGKYLTVSGRGAPASKEFGEKLGSLYGCAYTIKFDYKKRLGRDFKVGVLEGLWWVPGRTFNAMRSPKETWRWKLLIRVPSFVSSTAIAKAIAVLKAKGRPTAAVKLETLREGPSVQVLHVGPYADEPATLARMESFARERRLRFRGRHHEVYLSDPRRVAPARMRTLLRHPVSG